jgi:hypothetical protein
MPPEAGLNYSRVKAAAEHAVRGEDAQAPRERSGEQNLKKRVSHESECEGGGMG